MSRDSTLRRFASFMGVDGHPRADAEPNHTTAMRRFQSDERGNVAITFGMLLTVMCTFVFSAIDVGRWLQARQMTLDAMDSAVLSGLRNYQSTKDDTKAAAVALATYKENVKNRTGIEDSGGTDTISFAMASNHIEMKAQGTATMKLPFLQLVNFGELPLLKTNTDPTIDEHAIAKAAVGANTGTSLEVSMMIDITGSMTESDYTGSTKIETVKLAAAALVDTLVWADQSQYTSKVAVVPFSQGVNLGTAARANAARGTINWGSTSTTPGSEGYKIGQSTFYASDVCVTERTGTHAFDDTSPSTAPVGRFYSSWGCPTGTPMMPLSSDKVALKNVISNLTANGYTAGQIGTAWAWYALSPNFNSLWPTADNAARPYSDLTALNPKGGPVLRKIAILMTDGDYNTQYCSGLSNHERNCNGDNGASQSQADALCTAMKAKGITVYTIGARVSATAKSFLQSCATSPDNYYDATDGNKLQLAFADITNKLVQLYIRH